MMARAAAGAVLLLACLPQISVAASAFPPFPTIAELQEKYKPKVPHDEPVPSFQLRPLKEHFPAFERGDPPSFYVSHTINAHGDKAWAVIKDQPALLTAFGMCAKMMELAGDPGQWLMMVKWWTPRFWHRWTRTEVRHYLGFNETSRSLSFVVLNGMGLYLPRLAFRETVVPGAHGSDTSTLLVEVWYELDEKYIGWDPTNLHKATRERWEKWYKGKSVGYARTVEEVALGELPLGNGKTCRFTDVQRLNPFMAEL